MSDKLYNADYRSTHNETLYAVCAISNPQRFHSRYKLYKEFEEHVARSGAQLLTVEAAYGRRNHVITQADNPWHIQLRTEHELWHKECMINLAIQRLPPTWRYISWLDSDIAFTRPDWVNETLHLLQHYQVLQLYEFCLDLLPDYGLNQMHKSFASCYQDFIHGRLTEEPGGSDDGVYTAGPRGVYWHAGFAWAARREAIDHLGGLIDWSICGANDHHMALALVGRLSKSIHGKCSPAFKESMNEWEARALKYIRKNIGFVPGTIYHNWHGAKTNRKYKDRWSIMVDSQFDPAIDIKKDWQGLYQLTDRRGEISVKLRDDLREYFRTRNEDSIDPNPYEKTIHPMMVRKEQTPLAVEPKTVDDAEKPVNDK